MVVVQLMNKQPVAVCERKPLFALKYHKARNKRRAKKLVSKFNNQTGRQTKYAVVVQLVERLLAKEKVAGSSPVYRSR